MNTACGSFAGAPFGKGWKDIILLITRTSDAHTTVARASFWNIIPSRRKYSTAGSLLTDTAA